MRFSNKSVMMIASSMLFATTLFAATEANSFQQSKQYRPTPEEVTDPALEGREYVPSLSDRFNASAQINNVDDTVGVVLKNTSSSNITFRVVGGTEPRVLAPGEETELLGLQVPTHITYYQSDGGLTHAEVVEVMDAESMISVELSQAENMADDSASMLVLETGSVYLL